MQNRTIKNYSFIAILLSCFSIASARPNIIFILADDMGYADIGCYGAKDVATPNLDKLAAKGIKFTNVYAMGAECTPSRTSLLTGRYPQRVKGMECAIGTGNVGRYDDAIELADQNELGLPASRAVLAPALNNAGYHNGVFGKWHLGYEDHFSPLDQGFDEFTGFLGGNVDYFHHVELSPIHVLLTGREKVKREGYTTDLISSDATTFIGKMAADKDTPFFLYLPHAAPHFPFQAPDSDTTLPTKENWLAGDRETYAKMIESLDDSVGNLVKALEETGQRKNTLIVFASDHGAIRPGDNGPYRDFKSTLFEGGIRVPLIANWPGHLEGGKTFEDVGTLMDLTTSFLRIGNATVPDGKNLDGIDLLQHAADGTTPKERTIPWRAKRGDRTWRAFRKGEWKYVSKTDGNATEEWLFNLASDPYEKNNLAPENPKMLSELKSELADWEAQVAL
ncbi:MAG: sulfatase-like hydrolase/transferase [Verrucomicrobiales bacterium]|nr:sulfatase-like hydrolase/transferase [Verrucomicrobiales bacterium]